MNEINDIDKTLALARGLAEVIDKLPFHINVIKSAARGKLRETAHSMILADLLRHPQIQTSFLKHFLDMNVSTTMKVETEVGSAESLIDIALWDKEHFVIIENKANWAGEQKAQIYRYVEDIAKKKYTYAQIYVLYLNAIGHNAPSEWSVSKDGKDIRDSLPDDHFKIWDFAHDIVEWLKSLKNIEEPFVQSAVHQYKDYLQHYYGTSEEMKQAMEKYLKEKFGITNETKDVDAIKKLGEESKHASALLNSIDKLLQEHRKQWLINTAKRLANEFNLTPINTFDDKKATEFNDCDKKWPKAGVRINAKGGYVICVLIEYGLECDNVNYGVRMSDKDPHYDQVKEAITHVMTSPESHPWWPCTWQTSYEDAGMQAERLIKAIFDSEL